MLTKILLSVLLLQAASMAEECADQEIVTKKIIDVNEIIGNWTVVFMWNKEIALRSMGRSLCVNTTTAKVTAEEVAAKKEACQHSQVPFDYDNVVAKISIPHIADRFVSHDGENAYIQQNCYMVTEVEARRVSENYIMMVYPGTAVAELLSKTVPEWEELSCTVRNIDVEKNKIGFPLCFK